MNNKTAIATATAALNEARIVFALASTADRKNRSSAAAQQLQRAELDLFLAQGRGR